MRTSGGTRRRIVDVLVSEFGCEFLDFELVRWFRVRV
jgi:hypothetical protein